MTNDFNSRFLVSILRDLIVAHDGSYRQEIEGIIEIVAKDAFNGEPICDSASLRRTIEQLLAVCTSEPAFAAWLRNAFDEVEWHTETREQVVYAEAKQDDVVNRDGDLR
jgi:hypothetical protein